MEGLVHQVMFGHRQGGSRGQALWVSAEAAVQTGATAGEKALRWDGACCIPGSAKRLEQRAERETGLGVVGSQILGAVRPRKGLGL